MVAQDQCQAYPGYLPEGQQLQGRQGYQNGPTHIQQQYRQGPGPSRLPIHVGGTGIAAAMAPRILAAGKAEYQDGEIHRSQHIGGDSQGNE
jgi:hypothetical protein